MGELHLYPRDVRPATVRQETNTCHGLSTLQATHRGDVTQVDGVGGGVAAESPPACGLASRLSAATSGSDSTAVSASASVRKMWPARLAVIDVSGASSPATIP